MSTFDQAAGALLRRAVEDVAPAADSPAQRARVVAALEAALQGNAQPHARSKTWWAAVAGVALLLGAAWAWRGTAGTSGARVVASSSAAGAARPAGAVLPWGAPIRTGVGERLTLALPHAVTLEVQSGAEVELRHDGAEVLLRAGAVAALVLQAEQTQVVVQTLDAQVFTRGARMTVTMSGGCDGRTGVSVDDGVVLVRRGGVEHAVLAGQQWPACATVAPSPGHVAVEEAPPTRTSASPSVPAPASKRAAPPPLATTAEVARPVVTAPGSPDADVEAARLTKASAPPSAPAPLSVLNERFAVAVALQRAGDVRGAVALLDQVTQAASPLAEPALAHKLRWLSASSPAEAKAAAREYLRRFPMGPARAEAEVLVLDAP